MSSYEVDYYYYYHFLKYLALKVGQLRQPCRPGSTLTQAVKQPYNICHLTGHVFRGVRWGNVNKMKMM